MEVIVKFGRHEVPFRVWKPDDGTVFQGAFGYDCETTRIDEERPWFVPSFVLGAACDGERGFFIERKDLRDFYFAHRGLAWCMHNAPFDLGVLQATVTDRDIYELVEQGRVWDTQLLHRLQTLATDGNASFGHSKLAECVQKHLEVELPKDVQDGAGRDVRTGFDAYLGRPISEIPPVYLEYLGRDALATARLFFNLRERIRSVFSTAQENWGYVSREWLEECIRRFGPLTHHIQLKAAIVLQSITANGLSIDHRRTNLLTSLLQQQVTDLGARLRAHGYQPGQTGCEKALQEILRGVLWRNPAADLPRTPIAGKYQTSEEALAPLAEIEPFVRDLLDFRRFQKMLSTFLGKMARSTVHPSFDTLVKSGRTSSFGELNAQNLPRDDRVRECFVPPAGKVFIDADYAAIEMVTLAQSVQSQLGLESRLAAALNHGQDPHRLVAAVVTGKLPADISKDERQQAKAINFGKPGGMGNEKLRRYAQLSYGVNLSAEQVEQLSEGWFLQFPEMRAFLYNETSIGELAARFFKLTPQAHANFTGSRKFLGHLENFGRENDPYATLGFMLLKVLEEETPFTRRGQPYDPGDIAFFWEMVSQQIDQLPEELHPFIDGRNPCSFLRDEVKKLLDLRGVFTLSGRLRAKAGFCQRHNTLFQGLAADGAKLALWNLWRAGYAIHNFIHDEVLVAVSDGPLLPLHCEVVRHLLVSGMKEVVPDVDFHVELVAARRWSKRAQPRRDDAGRPLPWEVEMGATDLPAAKQSL